MTRAWPAGGDKTVSVANPDPVGAAGGRAPSPKGCGPARTRAGRTSKAVRGREVQGGDTHGARQGGHLRHHASAARHGNKEATDTQAGMGSILVVEDEPAIADSLERGLRAHGHSTAVTDEPSRALALALSGDFDLIVLDLGLPGGDGFDVLRAVRERGRQIPIIILTGRVEERDAEACLEAGADDYMTKPFRFDELLARIAVLLGRPDPPGGS